MNLSLSSCILFTYWYNGHLLKERCVPGTMAKVGEKNMVLAPEEVMV